MRTRALIGVVGLLLAGVAQSKELDHRAVCLEVTSKFFELGLHSSQPLDSELWELKTEEMLSKRHAGEVDLPAEAFTPEAEQSLRMGNWKAYFPADLGVLEFELFSDYINGWLKSRDKYASWEGDGASFRRDAHLEGKYRGIGVAWSDERGANGELTVSWVAPSGPAEEAGVKAGDIVTSMVSDTRKIDLSEVPLERISVYVRAADVVTLAMADGRSLRVAPREVSLDTAKSSIDETEDAIFIRFRSVNQPGLQIVSEGIQRAKDTGKELVLDLSGNHGGHTNLALDVCGYFKGSGVVDVEWLYRDKWGRSRIYELTALSELKWSGSLRVIVDENTASAAEIIAMALSSRPNTTIEGGETYGKHESQNLESLNSNGRLRVTVSEFRARK